MNLKLQNFEGPIELLYNLIDERKLDISQISLAEVTEQYLSHIKNFKETNPKNLAEFLVVAAKLILIKSRTLLPSLEISKEEDADIGDLQRKLELYKKLRELTKQFKKISRDSQPMFSREFMAFQQVVFLPPKDTSKHTLAENLKNMLSKIPKTVILPQKTIETIISFEEIIKNLHYRIINTVNKTFSEAVQNASIKMDIILTFLAMLELVKQKNISANQTEIFGEIHFTKHEA